MTGDSDISWLAWQGGPLYMTDTQPQSLRRRPLQHGHRNSNPWNLNAAQNIPFFDRRTGQCCRMHFFSMYLRFQFIPCYLLVESCVEESECNIGDGKTAGYEQ